MSKQVKVKAMEGSKIIELSSFLKYADAFYLSIGLLVYDREKDKGTHSWYHSLLHWYFILQMLNLNFALVTELIYVFLAISGGTNFLEATMNMSFIGFVIVGELKIWLIWRQREHLTLVVNELERLHPRSAKEQAVYNIKDHLSSYSRVSIFYFSMHLLLIWTYNLYWVAYYLIYDLWLGVRKFERMLPYYCWVPWDWTEGMSYYFIYVSQNIAGQACLSGQLSADLMMCALVTLLVMHFRQLGSQIEQFKAGIGTEKQDMKFLHAAIRYHQRLLQLSDDINNVFGVSLLCNFVSSSFIICFVGFHMTIGGKLDNVVMLVLFLFCAMVQVFMISNYAQRLLDSSEYIGQAVYNHDWFNADILYRKMLVLITRRSQKPSRVKATSFLNVSLVTVTDILQLSYKFFALLRTMYMK
ncbi:putative odorant receptor 85d [Scaptodrosophila lebanonensis]|uniref:Odorant receptor n=1 Tax=Drosophila lebanonensis TaxID=7225 RepID=A0A6J2TMC9_DROLE|nr:putative odorant receptor 85d [Scaptodrosophila lebanonensis]